MTVAVKATQKPACGCANRCPALVRVIRRDAEVDVGGHFEVFAAVACAVVHICGKLRQFRRSTDKIRAARRARAARRRGYRNAGDHGEAGACAVCVGDSAITATVNIPHNRRSRGENSRHRISGGVGSGRTQRDDQAACANGGSFIGYIRSVGATGEHKPAADVDCGARDLRVDGRHAAIAC